METDPDKASDAQVSAGRSFERAFLREKRARLRAEEMLERQSRENLFAIQKLQEYRNQLTSVFSSNDDSKRRMPRFALLALLLAFWVAAIGAGMARLWHYAATPGNAAMAPREWPRQSPLGCRPGYPTLVVLVHPQCPCTRATIEELSLVMTQLEGRLTAHVLYYRPREAPEGWEHTDIWRNAEAIPGVTVHSDDEGVEAARFGAMTSGQVLLYDAHGRLRFQGGITLARGHAGDNMGRRQLITLASQGPTQKSKPHVVEHPVFGCPLFGKVPSDEAADRQEGAAGGNAR